MTHAPTHLLALALLGSLGCTAETVAPSGAWFTANPVVAATTDGIGVAATVHLQISNHSRIVYTYGSCTRWIERREGASWVRLGDPDAPCPSDIAILGAWQVHRSDYSLEESLPAGSYRFRFDFGQEADPLVRVVRASNPFDWPM